MTVRLITRSNRVSNEPSQEAFFETPPGVRVGDFLVGYILATPTQPIRPISAQDAGWTFFESLSLHLTVMYRWADASDTIAGKVYTFSAHPDSGLFNFQHCVLACVRGANPADPILGYTNRQFCQLDDDPVCIGQSVGTGDISATSANLTLVTGSIEEDYEGFPIKVAGAGPGGTDLLTTIAVWTDSTHVVLSDVASTTVSAAEVRRGKDGNNIYDDCACPDWPAPSVSVGTVGSLVLAHWFTHDAVHPLDIPAGFSKYVDTKTARSASLLAWRAYTAAGVTGDITSGPGTGVAWDHAIGGLLSIRAASGGGGPLGGGGGGGGRRERRYSGLGGLRHEFVGGGDSLALDVVGGFSAQGDAPGGFKSLSGELPREYVEKHKHIFTFGSTWRVRRKENGKVVAAGRVLDPGFEGDRAVLVARGWGTIAEVVATRLLYQSWDYDQWTPANGDPHRMNNSKHIKLPGTDGKLMYEIAQDEVFEPGANYPLEAGYIFGAKDQPIHHLTYRTHTSRDLPDNTYKWRVRKGHFPSNLQQDMTQDGIAFNVTDGVLTDRELSGSGYDMVRLNLCREFQGTETEATEVWVTDVRVNGIAPGDHFSVADVVQDLCARLGVAPAQVQANGLNAMPFDMEDSPYGDALDSMSMLVDWRWLFFDNGTGPICDFGPWDTRTWVVPEGSVYSISPLERYNGVSVPYRYGSGVTANQVVMCEPDPFPLGIVNIFGGLSLEDPLPFGAEKAESLGRAVADLLCTRRYGGNVQLQTVISPNGLPVSAYEVLPGDTLVFPREQVTGRVRSLSVSDVGVTATLDESLAVMQSIIARRHRQVAL